jgi:hypothetical protein
MKRAAVFIIFMTLAFSGSTFALGKPDFSGTWNLDMTKSDMVQERSRAMSAARVTIVIKQTPAVLTTTRNVGKHPETAAEKLDGSESINKSPSGQDIKSTSRWEGSTLITKSFMSTGQGTVESTFVRSLSADGKVMTIDVTMKTTKGVSKKKLIYNKQ